MMLIDNSFNIGDTVYLKNDKNQDPYIIVGILVSAGGTLEYRVRDSSGFKWLFELEMTVDKNHILTTTN